MANNDVMIKDAPLVGSLNGNEKIPISDGSNRPRAVSIEMIKSFVGNKEVDLSGYATKEELEEKQDKISDLAAIREGAGKGGVAYKDLPNKVDKIEGKALSTNDYTNEDKEKLVSLKNYDDTEIRSKIEEIEANKQDKINDLETIREGANLGATALQSIPSEYATTDYVDNAIQSAITIILNTEV